MYLASPQLNRLAASSPVPVSRMSKKEERDTRPTQGEALIWDASLQMHVLGVERDV